MKQKKPDETVFWEHAGGKLREEGPEALTTLELVAILIGSGTRDRSAEDIANEIIQRFESLSGMMGQPLDKFLEIKGLGDVRITRIAAAFEIARRITQEAVSVYEQTK